MWAASSFETGARKVVICGESCACALLRMRRNKGRRCFFRFISRDIRHQLLPLGEPLGDPGAKQGLRLAAYKHADVAAWKRQLRVILAADLCAQRLRRGGREDGVRLWGGN